MSGIIHLKIAVDFLVSDKEDFDVQTTIRII